jgi:hypothetical protein
MGLDRALAIAGLIYIWVSSTEKSLPYPQALNLLEAIGLGVAGAFLKMHLYIDVFFGEVYAR